MFQYNRPKVKWQIQRPSRKVKWNLRVGWEVIWIFYACDESKRKLSYACHNHTDNHLALWSDTIDDHGAPSFPLTDMNKKRRWNTKKTGARWRNVERRSRRLRVAALFPDVLCGRGGQVSLGELASVVEWCIAVVVRIAELLLAHDSVDLCTFGL